MSATRLYSGLPWVGQSNFLLISRKLVVKKQPRLPLSIYQYRKCTLKTGSCTLVTAAKDFREDLKGKTIVVVGLGKSGRAAARLALARGASSVIGLDSNPATFPLEHDESVFQGFNKDSLRTELGPHNTSTLRNASVLIVSPGVPANLPAIAGARQEGVLTLSELAFAYEVLPAGIPVAAISGTNGKSTVTSFTGQFLEAAGVSSFVGGNLGRPLSEAALQCLQFPPNDPPYKAIVVEVSSYQMELPGNFKPKAAAILNLTPDHLDRHVSMENYGAHKCRMFRHMAPDDLAIIPRDNQDLRRLTALSGGSGTLAWLGGLPGVQLDSQARRAVAVVPTTGAEARLFLSGLQALGRHNAQNCATAALLSLALDVGVSEELLQGRIPLLRPLPHRMEAAGLDSRSVLWINDSKATNVESTVIGIKAVVGRKAVVLLGGIAKASAGGNTSSLGFQQLVKPLEQHRAVVAFGASGDAIAKELISGGLQVPCIQTKTMAEAVEAARDLSHPHDVVLLSPACASFDEFMNFEHRGQEFRRLVMQG